MQLNNFMPTFAVQKIDAINGKQVINKLVVNGVSLFDQFEDSLEEKYKTEMESIYYYMEAVANLQSLPENKFRELKGAKDNVKEYEFKSNHIRVYAIKQPNCKLVVMCGYKNSQKDDINKFRSIKSQFIISQKNNKHENKG